MGSDGPNRNMWRVYFFFAGMCNLWHTSWRLLYGDSFIMGPGGPPANRLIAALLPWAVGPRILLCMTIDAILWFGVGAAGLTYISLGTFELWGGWKRFMSFCRFWGYAKLVVATSLLCIWRVTGGGEYTVVFGLLEYFWDAGFLCYYRAGRGRKDN